MNKLIYSAIGVLAVMGGLLTTTPAFAQAVDTTPPSIPVITSITVASPAKVDVSWSASTDNVAVTGYNVYRNSVLIAKTSGNSYSDLGLAASTSYSYTIAAYDLAGNASNQSSPVSMTTLATSSDMISPSIPVGLAATVISSSQINLSWTASTDNVGVIGYKIYRNGIAIGSSANTAFANTGLLPQTAHSYTVAAYDNLGNLSSQSGSVTATTSAVATDTTPPSVPTNLTATAVSSDRINLSWTAATDNAAVTGYRIFRNDVLIGTSSGTTFSDSGLLAQTTYNYKVSAYDAAGNVSGLSNMDSSTTLAAVNPRHHDDDDDDDEHGDRHHDEDEHGDRHHDEDEHGDRHHKIHSHHGNHMNSAMSNNLLSRRLAKIDRD